ncbi:hypothetical protein LbFV_ORF1 [Leptopilina boulardi filamentous virus]|uniref:Uncharacterized protein n=1 Tax=Leptopilina boulardi filamentous virus TaxID=552509 RepID=A0A1S5YCY9_9VIRU|nr:hypothetical protein LbFV_ORF1 [Leptopilina boulardi filamentous virus]AQQ79921.1 hypothetical protein LbFV_ORF1 [Leptopilina boulardi filamentous virus]
MVTIKLLDISLASHFNVKYPNCKSVLGLTSMIKQAFDNHVGVTLDPRCVWISIVYQFYLIITYNAEHVRDLFVNFEKKKKISSPQGLSMEDNVKDFNRQIHHHIADKELIGWIKTKFSTSTEVDDVVLSIMLMGTVKEYFDYTITECGIPAIQIVGTVDDWTLIKGKLLYLEKYIKIFPQYDLENWIIRLNIFADNCIKALSNNIDVTNINADDDYVLYFKNFCISNHVQSSGLDYIEGHCIIFNNFFIKKNQLYENTKKSKLSAEYISCEMTECKVENNYENKVYTYTAGNMYCHYNSATNMYSLTPYYAISNLH